MGSRLLFVLCALGAPAALAQSYQPYPIGERATGLAGAYTALAEDEAGAFYNPAGLAFTRGNSLSVSTSFYGLVFGSIQNGLGNGNDFNYSTLNLVPINASSLWHFGKAEEGKSAPWVFAFSVFTPSSVSVETRNDLLGGAINFFLDTRQKNVHLGPTLAYRLSDRLSLGLSVFGVVHTESDRADYTALVPSMEAGKKSFAHLTVSREQFDVGLLGSLGVRFQATERWSFGVCVRSPTVQVHGSGTQYTRLLVAQAEQALTEGTSVTEQMETAALLPLRVSLGAAYTRPRDLTLSLDAVLYAPIEFRGYHSRTNPAADTVHYGLVVNAALGVEKYVTPSFPLRVGVFTDLAGAPPPEVDGPSDDQTHRFGATVTVGIETERTSTTLGVVGTVALMQTLGLDVTNSFDAFKATGQQYSVFFVLSSSYSY